MVDHVNIPADEERKFPSVELSTMKQGRKTLGEPNVLEWSVQSFTVGSGDKEKKILRNVAGVARSGELTAVIGPSGAGKTTLLECLALRNRAFEGALRFNGKPTSGAYYTQVGMVYQQELFFTHYTPREHLTFHALARMSGQGYTKAQILERVEEVIKELRLRKCADTLIGGVDILHNLKGLSGGERKRLSIASELLTCPNVLFLDEPASGLDSVMTESLFRSLKDLASKGRIIMTSVHCPSPDMLALFSHILLLTCDGRLAYHGPTEGALGFFAAQGHVCPSNFNAADFMLRLVSTSTTTELVDSDESSDDDEEAKGVSVVPESDEARLDRLVKAFACSSYNAVEQELKPDRSHRDFKPVSGTSADSFTLFRLNVWRMFLQTKRDWTTWVLWGLLCSSTGLIMGLLYMGQAGQSWRQFLGLIFATNVSLLFESSMGVMVRYPLEWTVVQREYMSGANSYGPYMLAEMLCTFILQAHGPIMWAAPLYYMTGMDPSPRAFLVFLAIFYSIYQAAANLGRFVSSLSAGLIEGLMAVTLITVPMLLFSGILYDSSMAPSYLGWIQDVSISNFGIKSTMSQQAGILPPADRQLLEMFIKLDSSQIASDILRLWIIAAVLGALTYVNFKVRARMSGQ